MTPREQASSASDTSKCCEKWLKIQALRSSAYMVKVLMEGVTEWKESVVSVYRAREFARICFSLQCCSHTFLGEKPQRASGGAPAQVPPSPPLEGLFRAQREALCSEPPLKRRWAPGRVREAVEGLAEPVWARARGDWRGQPCVGQPCVGQLVLGSWQEPAAPARFSSEAKDPSFGIAGFNDAVEARLLAICGGIQDRALLVQAIHVY